MKVLCVWFALVAVCTADYYNSDKSLNLDNLVQDPNELHRYVKCFNDHTQCDDQIAAVRKEFGHALVEACEKCTSNQKHYTKLFFKGIKEHFPTEYEDMCRKFDPENKLFPALLKAVEHY